MSFLNGFITLKDIPTLLVVVFAVLFLGYALGRITIKGVSLGDAGVFIVALIVGALLFTQHQQFGLIFSNAELPPITEEVADPISDSTSDDSIEPENLEEKKIPAPYDFSSGLKLIENLGLILFVTSVGFIAGPKFFGNFKKNFKSYVILGLVVIMAGGLAALGCIALGDHVFGYGATIESHDGFVAMIVGLLSGSLTSTPAFSAAKDTVLEQYEGLVSVGHGIAYIFGVIGVVLFVQLIPKFTKADMEKERALLEVKQGETKSASTEKLFSLDHMGIAVFALAAIIGLIIGNIKIPLTAKGLFGTCFSLTATGGCLLTSLVLGHFGRIGKINIMPEASTLKLFRELGLVLFLVGAGIPGGAEFIANFDPMYFVYGIIMTIVPLIIGYLFSKYVLKLSLLNNLGSITGGMTSTPALGTLISVAKTEDVAAAYAATYPIALVAVVLASQFLIILF